MLSTFLLLLLRLPLLLLLLRGATLCHCMTDDEITTLR